MTTLRRPPKLKFTSHLTLLVIIALVLAVLLGYFYPAAAVKTQPLGDWFIAVIKVFIPFVIFFTIVPGISGMSNLKRVGRIGVKSLLYFEIITTLSLAIGIILAEVIKPGKVNRASLAVQDASKYTRSGAGHIDWGKFLSSNLTLQVLVIAIIVGIIISLLRNKEKILAFIEPITEWVFFALRFVMLLAPLGAFGGMASTIGQYGIRTFLPLGQ